MVMTTRLNGINPLSYMGVNPYTPAPLFISDRAPTSQDYQNFLIGTVWLVSGQNIDSEIWVLVSLEESTATWVELYPGGSGGLSTINCEVGEANEVGGAISILGGANVSTSGSGSTVTIDLAGEVTTEFTANSGSAVPVDGVINILGGNNINTTASGNTVTANLNNSITVGGTLTVDGATTLNGATTVVGNATLESTVTISPFGSGVVQSTSSGSLFSNSGSNGQILIGSSTRPPAWANLTSLNNTISITNGSNSIDLSTAGGAGTSSIFYAYFFSTTTPYTNPGTYQLGSFGVPMATTVNQGSVFYGGNGSGSPATFTAPSTGIYYLFYQLYCLTQGPQISSSIVTPSITYQGYSDGFSSAGPTALIVPLQAIVSLNSGDVVTFTVTSSAVFEVGGAGATSILGYRLT